MRDQPKWPWEDSPDWSPPPERPRPVRRPEPPPVTPLNYRSNRIHRSVGEEILRVALILVCILVGIGLLLIGACFALAAGMGNHGP